MVSDGSDVLPWVVTVVAAVSTLFSSAWAVYLKGHSNRVDVTDQHAAELASMREKIRQLELAQARMESPLMKQVQDLLSAGLHHPDPLLKRQDALLERLDRTILTPAEAPELVALLDAQIASPATTPAEAEAARALKAIMPLVVREQEAIDRVERSGQTG